MRAPPRLWGAVAVAVLASLASSALAHHVVSDNGIASVMPRTVLNLDAAAATFDHGPERGHWQTLTPNVEIALGRRVSFFAALPMARIAHIDGPSVAGPGDLSLSAKVGFFETEHGELLLAGGLGFEVPTGDDEDGLGGGHFQVSPFVGASTAAFQNHRWPLVVFGVISPRFTLDGHHHHDAGGGSLLEPHASREVLTRLMAALAIGKGYFTTGLDAVAALVEAGEHALVSRSEGGYVFGGHLRLYLGFDASVAGDRRFGVRGRGGAAWMF